MTYFLTEEGKKRLEDLIDSYTACNFDIDKGIVSLLTTSQKQLDIIITLLNNNKVLFKKNGLTITFYEDEGLKLFSEELSSKYCFKARSWRTPSSYTTIQDFDHQRLSNIIGLYEIYLTLNKLSQEESNSWLKQIEDSIIPEISEKYNGIVLDFVPAFDWDKKLYQNYLAISKK